MTRPTIGLRAKAGRLGIPLKIAITDDIRYDYCDARIADLTSIEGKHALYTGECSCGHNYQLKRLIADLQKEHLLSINTTGQIEVKHNADDKTALEEY